MNNKIVLFYSNKCQHSKDALEIINKNNLNILTVSIESGIKLPSFLKVVPTLIVPNIKMPLEGSNVFEWMKKYIQQNTSSVPQARQTPQLTEPSKPTPNTGEIKPYFSNEMTGFSDNYSYIGNESPMDHTYQFLGQTAGAISSSNQNPNMSSKEKEFKSQYDKMLEARKNDQLIPGQIKRT